MSSIGGATTGFSQVPYTPLPTPPADTTSGSTQSANASQQSTAPTQQTTAVQQVASTNTPSNNQSAPSTPATTTNPAILLAHNADGTIGPHHKHVHKHTLESAQADTADQVLSVNVHA